MWLRAHLQPHHPAAGQQSQLELLLHQRGLVGQDQMFFYQEVTSAQRVQSQMEEEGDKLILYFEQETEEQEVQDLRLVGFV